MRHWTFRTGLAVVAVTTELVMASLTLRLKRSSITTPGLDSVSIGTVVIQFIMHGLEA
jgi:hypothetical protein